MNSKSAFISDFDKEQNNRKPLLLNQIGSDKGVPCTFAEINDLTYQINLKNLNMDQSKYALDRESQESRTGNCMCYKEVEQNYCRFDSLTFGLIGKYTAYSLTRRIAIYTTS